MTSSPAAEGYGPGWKRLFEQKGWWHSFELPGRGVIEGVNSLEGLKQRVAQYPIPQDLAGRRVLDIGTWDGWFAFEMERRGAEVLAVDCIDNPRFREIHSIYGSRVEYRQMDMFDISPETVGRFDYVLFLGVLYHLKHPMLALEKVCAVATELAVVESYILPGHDPAAPPVLEFYESDEKEGQFDNWCAPNLACLMSMCRATGFARVELRNIQPYGACVACHRRWTTPQDGATAEVVPVEVIGAAHRLNGGINFDTRKDEYVMVQFHSSQTLLGREDIQPSVGGYGVYPIGAHSLRTGLWQVNFKLPPGLTPGWHDVTVALKGPSQRAAAKAADHAGVRACRIAVDLPLPACSPRITGLCDGTTWAREALDLGAGRILSLWCSGLPENADRANIEVLVNGLRCALDVPMSSETSRQINATVPEGVRAGRAEIRVRADECVSDPAWFEIRDA